MDCEKFKMRIAALDDRPIVFDSYEKFFEYLLDEEEKSRAQDDIKA